MLRSVLVRVCLHLMLFLPRDFAYSLYQLHPLPNWRVIFLVYVNHLWFVISEIDPLTTSDQFKQLIHLIRRISA
jgi:hypothetical protein